MLRDLYKHLVLDRNFSNAAEYMQAWRTLQSEYFASVPGGQKYEEWAKFSTETMSTGVEQFLLKNISSNTNSIIVPPLIKKAHKFSDKASSYRKLQHAQMSESGMEATEWRFDVDKSEEEEEVKQPADWLKFEGNQITESNDDASSAQSMVREY